MHKINIPTVKDNLYGFDKLFELWHDISSLAPNSHIIFNFSSCYTLSHNAVAFIGGLIRYIEHKSIGYSLELKTIRPKLRSKLSKNNFLRKFASQPRSKSHGNHLPLREDTLEDHSSIINYIKERWLRSDLVFLSDRLRNALIGKLWEIYANAFEHSKSPIGVLSCGQIYPRKRAIKFTIVDFGVGIPLNVNNYLLSEFGIANLSASACIEWALQSGNSTSKNVTKRGLGLSLLLDFIKVNKGSLEVFSHNAYNCYTHEGEKRRIREQFFPGTVISISIQCPDIFYKFSDE